jgi:hypothetical protein
MYHPFSVAETVKAAWDIMKKNFIVIIVYSVISFILLSVLAFIIGFVVSPEEFLGKTLVAFILIIVQAYTTLGLYKLIFTLIDKEYYEFEFSQTLPNVKMVFSYLAVIFIFAFIVTNYSILVESLKNHPKIQEGTEAVGVFVLLYLILRVMFFNTFIVDDNSGPIESIKQSFQLTKGYFIKVLIMLLIIILLIFLPAKISQYYPVVSITIMFTYPFVNIILAVTYRKLVYSHQDIDDDIAETN